jgi:glycosyltransferase involved in cell wall biosynthesis
MASWVRALVDMDLVVTRHVVEEPAETLREQWRAALALRGMEKAHTTVAVSRAAAARLETLAAIPPRRLRVIPNGIALDRFEPGRLHDRRAPLRASLGFEKDDHLILFPAAFRAGKGHDVLLAAVPRLLESCPRARVLLAGEGPLREPLEDAAAPLGRATAFLGARDDVPELMGAADLVVLPSLSEALPTVAMEAAASGTAIVASRVGGVPEVVTDGVTGTLVAPGEPTALSRAIEDLLLNSDRRWAFGAAGRRRAERDFGMDSQVARTVELWWEVVGGRGRSA